MTSPASPVSRRTFDAAQLIAEFPPRITHPNKRVVHGIACPPDARHAGRIEVTRWAALPLPETVPAGEGRPAIDPREDFFGYEPTPAGSNVVEWDLNFADRNLFGFYGGPLFAQDEMQVAEHPALASLREALPQAGVAPLTVEDGRPTPILVKGVERRCRVRTAPDAAAGRAHGLYGNAFARAGADTVARATEALDPPTVTNIIAMEAPPGGWGRYSRADIEYILATAYTGFAAARQESLAADGSASAVVVHTGWWGCGAYGGNRLLMAILQVVAARLAGIDRVVFHTGDAAGARRFGEAMSILDRELRVGEARALADLVVRLEAMGFEWGVSDGN